MTRSLLLLAALAFVFVGWADSAAAQSFTFQNSSKIWVEGTSSMHDWSCDVAQFAGTVAAEPADGGLAALTGTSLIVPVQGIDCDNGTMNGKVRDALGSSPVRYALKNATPGAPDADGWFSVRTAGDLTLNGTTRPIQMDVRGKAVNGGLRFTGQYSLKMTDYGISPPTAMLGALKTGDQVTVHFDVTVAR